MQCPHCGGEIDRGLGWHMDNHCSDVRPDSDAKPSLTVSTEPDEEPSSHRLDHDEVYEALPDVFCVAEVAREFEFCYNTVKKRIWDLEAEGRVKRLSGTDIWQRNHQG